jgi:hypothetical protein
MYAFTSESIISSIVCANDLRNKKFKEVYDHETPYAQSTPSSLYLNICKYQEFVFEYLNPLHILNT